MPQQNRPTYDVAILGSGIAGSMLGAILAQGGASVLLIDADSHPKFAIGESTIPYTLVTLRTIAERYNVPEIKTLATFTNCSKIIGPSFGVKKHFAFMLHHEGRGQDPKETNQFSTPGLLHEASHLYRQDTDAYLFHAAVHYGCDARQNFRVADVDFDDAGATLTGTNGEEYRARYVVDASGFRSPLAAKFDLREEPSRFKHHSRSLWTHMTGVTPTDDLFKGRAKADVPPVPWYEGTVHHMIPRGWFWTIGFDNHPSSRNPLCSVGLTLDERKYPKDRSLTPAEEFAAIAERYPDIARQYAGAVPARGWTSTERLQYSSKRTVGDRWCLLSHAAGFIDPLFSRGLSNTAEAINALAWRLLRAFKDDDFSAERFDFVDRLQQGLLDYNDELVNAAYISFEDYDLWSAVFRIWAWGSNAGTFRLQEALTRFLKDGREDHFLDLEEASNLGFYWPDHAGYRKLFDEMVAKTDAYEAGQISAGQAADDLYDSLREADFVPKHFGFAERDQRFLNPTPKTLFKTVRWARKEADPVVRQLMVNSFGEAVRHKVRGRRIF
ncbi:NAD(P)/FAD-dependent oxidoreductase [Streptomyces sp. CA-111067]|uniref:NAD(P)/FAD-dependent oxidoreductase n=1 Tax=Streptomyces sp. CA-111067 TaxID=3240046 RepID=UPI003D9518CD